MKVRLYVRIRLSDGTRQYADAVYAANGKLKPKYAAVDGHSRHHPEGVYYLRYLSGAKRVWESVGSDAQLALLKKVKKERLLDAREAGLAVADDSGKNNAPGRSLAETISDYVSDLKATKSKKTVDAYSWPSPVRRMLC